MSADQPIPVIEWSRNGVRAYDPLADQTVVGADAGEALAKIGHPPVVGLCLGRRASFVREFYTPNVSREDARTVIQLQLEQLFPLDPADVAFDFWPSDELTSEGRITTVAAASGETLRAARKAVEEAGAKIAWSAPSAVGSASLAGDAAEAVIVDAHNGDLTLDVVKRGKVVHSRIVTDPGDVDGRIAELERTIAAASLNGAVVLVVPGVDLGSGTTSTDGSVLQAMASHSAGLLDIELPEHYAKRTKRSIQNRARLAVVLWAAVLIVGAFFYLGRYDAAKVISDATAVADRRQSTAEAALAARRDSLNSATRQVSVLNQAFAPSQPAVDVLTLVSNSMPEGAWLTGLTWERGKPLLIRGTALNRDLVSELIASLAVNERLRDVELQYANDGEIETTPVVQFNLTAHVVGNLPLAEMTRRTRRSRR